MDNNMIGTISGSVDSASTMVKWNELDATGQDLMNYAEHDIKNQIEKIQDLRKQVNWEGADAETSLKGFDEFMTEMQKLTLGLSKYGAFLSKAAGSYKETSGKIKNTFENDVYRRG